MAADVVPIFLQVPRAEIGYVKFVFESYEGVAVLRTIDRRAGILVVLAVPDFLDQARSIVAALAGEMECREIDPPPGSEDLLGPDLGEISDQEDRS
jgi:hypothetical protein